MVRNYILLLLIAIAPVYLNAQFVATGTNIVGVTPTSLVQQDLVGAGITISNITTNIGAGADPRQFARFTNANSALPFSSGVMLCSGYSDDFNNVGNTQQGFTSIGGGGCLGGGVCGPNDTDLDAIITPNPSHDAAVLEFDFIPLSDTVRFRYVMASEEYPEFACATFNDVFAFFLSGPGIAGTQNIAVVPGSAPPLPVSINTINPGIPGLSASIPHTCVPPNGSLAFSAFYVDNSVSATFQFDGLTTVLEAVAVVIPCSTYHIKLAIADAFDGAFDSAVFFEANSFTSDVLDIDVVRDRPDSILVEGCGDDPFLTFTLASGIVSSPYPIPLNIFGSAINGTDYSLLPDTIFINSGDSSVTISLTAIADGLSEGTETIFIEVQKSACETDTIPFVIIDGAPVTAAAAVTSNYNGTDISCNSACDAVTTVIGAGGITLLTGDFTYQWDSIAGSQTTAAATGLCPGNYQVIVFDDNLCADTVNVSVTEPSAVTATISNVVNSSCATLGQATASGSGGNGGFSFLWPASASNQTTATATGLIGGAYQVTVSDQNGCTDTITVNITSTGGSAVLIDSTTNISCNGGTNGSIFITGAGIGLTYLWSNNATTEDISGLAAGTYTVTVTDNSSCVSQTSTTITEPTSVTASISSSTSVTCNNGINGTATAIGLGGTGGTYSFSWSDIQNQTTTQATGLTAGIYTVAVTDSNNCTNTTNVTITEPSQITATITTTPISCNGGDDGIATIIAGGNPNTPPYTFDWGNGSTTSTTSPGSPFGTAGVHTVTVTDGNGCTITENYTITEPSAMSFTIGTTDASCNGYADGTASINVSGGVGGFTYVWNSSSQTTATATGLLAGLHCVTATDTNGCSVDTCIQVNEPSGFSTPTFIPINVSCFGGNDGQLNVNVTGSVSPYSYLWNINNQTTTTATGLSATSYTVTISDANGCTISASSSVSEPTPLQISLVVDSVQCKNGSSGQIEAIVSGGNFPYAYLWNPTANNQNTAIATGLAIGTYTVTVTDFNGCTITDNDQVFEPLTILTASIINQSNPLCNGSCDGMIEVDALGATPNYTFIWSNGQTSSIATGVCSGTHNVTVSDANNCTVSVGGSLSDPAPIVVDPQVLSNFNGSPISCPGAADGSVGVTASGGTGGLTYTWSPLGQNTPVISGLLEDTYCVTVTDAVGCTADTCVTISDPVPLAATFTKVDIFCNGDANGQILVTATPGTGTLGVNGYEYKITGPGQSGNVFSAVNNFSNLGAGTYTVVVRDGNNCEIQLTIDIVEPPLVLIDSVVIVDALCFGAASGTATAFPSGGVGNFTYQWSGSAAGQT
ncbi:MAG: choice-of-anchor L domain-containing protein, partial [Saprospiraceae bacterium]|nr:choice-of-anchor L domain-containing protein [Saprospiraceae bacterium]